MSDISNWNPKPCSREKANAESIHGLALSNQNQEVESTGINPILLVVVFFKRTNQQLGSHGKCLVIFCEGANHFSVQKRISPTLSSFHCFLFRNHGDQLISCQLLNARQLTKNGLHDHSTPVLALPIPSWIGTCASDCFVATGKGTIDIIIDSGKEISQCLFHGYCNNGGANKRVEVQDILHNRMALVLLLGGCFSLTFKMVLTSSSVGATISTSDHFGPVVREQT